MSTIGQHGVHGLHWVTGGNRGCITDKTPSLTDSPTLACKPLGVGVHIPLLPTTSCPGLPLDPRFGATATCDIEDWPTSPTLATDTIRCNASFHPLSFQHLGHEGAIRHHTEPLQQNLPFICCIKLQSGIVSRILRNSTGRQTLMSTDRGLLTAVWRRRTGVTPRSTILYTDRTLLKHPGVPFHLRSPHWVAHSGR